MRRLPLWVLAAVLLATLPSAVSAGDWSAEQKEVWGAIEACDQAYAAKNSDVFLDCIHDDFSGWLYTEPVPRGKSTFENIGMHFFKTRDVVASELRPIDIEVYDNVAVIHYFFVNVTKDPKGEESYEQGRWTDIMLKEGGKWRWIADHGGAKALEEMDVLH